MSDTLNDPKGSALPQLAHHIVDPLRRSRVLWGGVCWVLAAVLTSFGIPYLVGGLHATSVPQAYEALTRYVPGGVHTYGGILLLYGLLLIHGLAPAMHRRLTMLDEYLHYVLMSVSGVGWLIFIAFAISWSLTGVQTWQAMIYWGSIAVLATLAAIAPPNPPDRSRAA